VRATNVVVGLFDTSTDNLLTVSAANLIVTNSAVPRASPCARAN